MQHFPDSVSLAPAPQAILHRLIASVDAFHHLNEAQPRIPVLLSQRALFLHGGRKAAVIIQPRWQGPLGQVAEFLVAKLVEPLLEGHDPDYVVIVDVAIWSMLDAERRERLIYHELCHLQVIEDEYGVAKRGKCGQPLLKLVPHDVEVFHAEIIRYGPEVVGIEEACEAIAEGFQAAERRKAVQGAA